jgi:hypothetical protein
MAPGMRAMATDRLSKEELISENRNWKLKVLHGEIKFAFDKKQIDKYIDRLNFIYENFPNEIVSGSLALNLFGLISRHSNDIDILISDKNKFSGYTLSTYGDEEIKTPNRLGYIEYKWKSNIFSETRHYEVDFFEDPEANFIELKFGMLNNKTLKIHNPVDIVGYKLKLALSGQGFSSTRNKHNTDLTYIFGQNSWQLVLKGDLII